MQLVILSGDQSLDKVLYFVKGDLTDVKRRELVNKARESFHVDRIEAVIELLPGQARVIARILATDHPYVG